MQYFQQTIMGYLNYFSFRLSYNETSSHGISLAEPTAFPDGDKETCPLDALRIKAEFMALKIRRKLCK